MSWVTHLADEAKAEAVAYLDCSKACDTIFHSILLDKVSAHGLDGYTVQWPSCNLRSIYVNPLTSPAVQRWLTIAYYKKQRNTLKAQDFGLTEGAMQWIASSTVQTSGTFRVQVCYAVECKEARGVVGS
ncbi:hypothetical protein WISP_09522 [Willisornis vidua]|uniref:Uncharacterized protein n=1 Tax=Willisornis vidua TaxID=1566151 RepID=A0ABQ9DRW9_9PASS|nr:hypothetical protein WISP_09522 [Willisornis vidua]